MSTVRVEQERQNIRQLVFIRLDKIEDVEAVRLTFIKASLSRLGKRYLMGNGCEESLQFSDACVRTRCTYFRADISKELV